jgi:hypothetical protein
MTQTLENSNITTSLFTRPELFEAFFSPSNSCCPVHVGAGL